MIYGFALDAHSVRSLETLGLVPCRDVEQVLSEGRTVRVLLTIGREVFDVVIGRTPGPPKPSGPQGYLIGFPLAEEADGSFRVPARLVGDARFIARTLLGSISHEMQPRFFQ